MKNFVKLIKQAHEEKFSAVLDKILRNKIPVAFLSCVPIAQAVENAKNFRAQGLNIKTLVTTNNPQSVSDFEVVHVSDAAKIFPQPEYVFGFDEIETAGALKYFPNSKAFCLYRGMTDQIYETFMAHLDDLQEVYESLIDEESKKNFSRLLARLHFKSARQTRLLEHAALHLRGLHSRTRRDCH